MKHQTTAASHDVTGEHRSAPRFSLRLMMTLADFEIPSANVSIGGAQLCCPAMWYPALMAKISGKSFPIVWTLPGETASVESHARVHYATPCEDEYLIGVEFVSFPGTGLDRWRQFLEKISNSRRLLS